MDKEPARTIEGLTTLKDNDAQAAGAWMDIPDDRPELDKLRQHVHKRLYQLAKAYMANKEAGQAYKHLEREIGCLKYMLQATKLPESRLKKLVERWAAPLKTAH